MTAYRDLKVEYESRGDLYVAEAEWRDSGRWVCEENDWVIRLYPDSGKRTVDYNGHLFNRQSKRRYDRCKDALVSEARSLINS